MGACWVPVYPLDSSPHTVNPRPGLTGSPNQLSVVLLKPWMPQNQLQVWYLGDKEGQPLRMMFRLENYRNSLSMSGASFHYVCEGVFLSHKHILPLTFLLLPL